MDLIRTRRHFNYRYLSNAKLYYFIPRLSTFDLDSCLSVLVYGATAKISPFELVLRCLWFNWSLIRPKSLMLKKCRGWNNEQLWIYDAEIKYSNKCRSKFNSHMSYFLIGPEDETGKFDEISCSPYSSINDNGIFISTVFIKLILHSFHSYFGSIFEVSLNFVYLLTVH